MTKNYRVALLFPGEPEDLVHSKADVRHLKYAQTVIETDKVVAGQPGSASASLRSSR